MAIFREFYLLFNDMGLNTLLCIAVGLIFIIIEIFQPGYGIFGVVGGILSAIGIALRVIEGGGNPLAQIFILIFLYSVLIIGAFLIMVNTVKKSWLLRSPKRRGSGEVNTIDTDTVLLDVPCKWGIAQSDLRPEGKVFVSGKLLDAVTEGFYIKKGEGIKVISQLNGKITVERAEM